MPVVAEGGAADPGSGPRVVRGEPAGMERSAPGAARAPMPQSFAEVVALFDERREALTAAQLKEYVHPVSFEPGRIELRPAADMPRDLVSRLGRVLGEWTGRRWLIAVSDAPSEPTPREPQEQHERPTRDKVAEHPLVRAVFETFPGATIAAVRENFAAAGPSADNPAADENLSGADQDSSEPDET
jgi:DNA polymerase-3 subunit gamma/tau